MEIQSQTDLIKDRLLDELGKAIKLIQQHTIISNERVLTQDSWLVKGLIHLLDKTLSFGLKDPLKGYWPLVREYTHPDLLKLIHSLKSINTSLGKGVAWLSLTLNEGATQNYLFCLAREEAALRRHYLLHGVLRDPLRVEQLLTLLAGLELAEFTLQLEITLPDASPVSPYLQSSTYTQPQANFFSRMTTSLTSSLASPVDSGVALVDSDTVSEATLNDNFSLREDPIELQDNRINAILDPDRFNELDYEELEQIKEATVLESDVGSMGTVKNLEAMTASDIVNQNHLKDDEIVFRRHRKKKSKQITESQNIKRVSFNEDLAAQFSASFLPEAPVKKCDVIAGRYSWCANGDAPYISKPTDPNATKSAMILPAKATLPERGMPEGQEDPPKLNSSTPRLASSDSESIRSGGTLNVSNELASCKKSLISRFIRSLHAKPNKRVNVKSKPIRSMYISGKFDLNLKKTLDEDIESYLNTYNSLKSEETLGEDFNTLDLNSDKWKEIFIYKYEKLLQIFPLTLGYLLDEPDVPALALLTNFGLYFVSIRVNHGVFCHFLTTLEDLDSIILGPSVQSAMIIRKKSKIKSDIIESGENSQSSSILACIADRNVAEGLISTIEYTMRSAQPPLPAPCVRILSLDDLRHLRKSLKQAGALDEEENLRHYSIVRAQDAQRSPPGTPLGPSKDGHLMYRLVQSNLASPWQPGYLRLKGGVLYIFNDVSSRLPVISIALGDPKQCSGLARPPRASRPHTFRIATPNPPSIELAAADDPSVSDWLQALLQAAALPAQIPSSFQEEKGDAAQCTLILGTQHIITCRESVIKGTAVPISCARVADITAVRFPSFQQWCIVEFGCREVVETGGDWVLYFATQSEMERFKKDLQNIWSETQAMEFPESDIQDDNVTLRCKETNVKLLNLWHPLIN